MRMITIPQMKASISHIAMRLNEPTMYWGQPGCGKSEAFAQAAEENNAVLVDLRLGQYDSVDMRGIPDPDKATKSTVWYPPSTLPFTHNDRFPDDRMILLALDEINAGSPPTLGVAYQLVQEGRVGEHILKPNVRICAAGNREGDKGVVNRMPLPLANRFTHYEIGVDVEAWSEWALLAGMPAVGIAFINYRKNLLSTFDPTKPDKAFATPRTWAKALRFFADTTLPQDLKQASMEGAVGDGQALEFWAFNDVWTKVVPIPKIIANPETVDVPDEASMMYATTVSVSGAMTPKNVGQLHKYLRRMSPEFTVLAWQLAVRRDKAMFGTPEFMDFSKQYKTIFN